MLAGVMKRPGPFLVHQVEARAQVDEQAHDVCVVVGAGLVEEALALLVLVVDVELGRGESGGAP